MHCETIMRFNPLSTRGVWISTHPSKNGIFKYSVLHFFKDDSKNYVIQQIDMDNIFHLVYSLCFYDQNWVNFNQFSGCGENV